MRALMYHGITSAAVASPAGREAGAQLYDVDIVDFRGQMSWLKEHAPDTIITFDDGEMNNYQLALPVLIELGLKAYFFIIVDRVGQSGYMGWPQLQALVRAGMKVGSHGLTHQILTSLTPTQVRDELNASKVLLETHLNTPVESFSVPRGFYNDRIIETAYEVGYTKVFVSGKPWNIKSPCTGRIAVKHNWTIDRFAMAVQGQTPVAEKMGDAAKAAAKTLLGESGYNWVRKTLLNFSK